MAKNWAIAIGINQYNNLQQLNYAKLDALAMSHWFEKEVRFDQVFLFTEDSPPIAANLPIPTQPTYGNLRRFLRVNFEEPLLAPGDNLWFFFSGHGRREADRDYLMLMDSDPGDVEHTAIPVDYVTQKLHRSGADNVVLFLDACRNEGSKGGEGIREKHQGVVIFYSCLPSQRSYEIEQLQRGSFTQALLEGLRIAGEGNCATVERLEKYLQSRVPTINQTHRKTPQNPYASAEPATKLHLILLPDYATLADTDKLKIDAYQAEVKGDWDLARQLWIRVNVATRGADMDAIEAFSRIPQASRTSSEPTTVPTGGRSVVTEPRPPVFEFDVVKVNASGQEVKREQSQAQYFSEDLGTGVSLEMVYVPNGKFMMGTEDEEIERLVQKYNSEWFRNEKPQHEVTVQSFIMAKYPVTQSQWRWVASLPKVKRDLNPEPSNFKGEKLPVEQVSWLDAVEFCDRLSKYTNKQYRLPSEAEWEYACRAGTKTPFYFGETITTELANYDGNYTYAAEPKGKYRQRTTEVGSFPPNAFGLYDMHGNVWEWCQDTYHTSYEGAPKDGSAWVDNDNRYHLLRGGSWHINSGFCRSAVRYFNNPAYSHDSIGFRVVCVAARIL